MPRCSSAQGVDALLLPTVEEMYPLGTTASTVVEVPGVSDILCGAFRPGHFRGVATVVVKLLNLVQPDVAIFGEKDYQQLTIIRRAVEDLCLPVRIVGAPTVRAEDGLALSSRNRYLDEDERAIAPRALSRARSRAAAADVGRYGPARRSKARVSTRCAPRASGRTTSRCAPRHACPTAGARRRRRGARGGAASARASDRQRAVPRAGAVLTGCLPLRPRAIARAPSRCARAAAGTAIVRRASSAAIASGEGGALPSATASCAASAGSRCGGSRCPPCARGTPLRVQAKSSMRLARSSPWRARKSASALSFAYRFQGQTSWQSSQP